MVNAQQYLLKQNYSNQIKNLDLSNQNLEGLLIISDFPNLETIECGNNEELTSLELTNLPKLNRFHANNCQLSEVKVNNCFNIAYFNVANNLLTNLNFLNNLNPNKLSILSIHSNNFAEQGLELFSNFTNLQQLFLDNCDKAKFRKEIYNRFTGSLQPLQNLAQLEILSIGKTNLDSGLEYLPASLRKIGFNFAIKADTGCSKLSQELASATRIVGVTEKLQQHEEGDSAWHDSYYRLAPWRQALNLLGEEEFRKQNTQQWLDQNYPSEIRSKITFLTINDKNLKGHLSLQEFTSLEKLDCSDNQLTNLDLSKCSNLTHLYCDNNSFADLNFLKSLPHPEKLKELYLGDNEKLVRQNLDLLTPFTNLEELSLENCPFVGSLRSLENLSKLERIYLSNTDLDDGLDDLPENCQRIYCDNSQGNKKSARIAKQLSQHSEEKFDENNKSKHYYDLKEWRENKQNNMIASIIPLERLYVIRGNMRQFLKKWGIKKVTEPSQLSQLRSSSNPDELWKDRWVIYSTQFIGRGSAIAGAVLTFQDQSAIGGGIVAIYPFAELIVSKLEERLKNKETKWKEFLTDADTFLDNYHELLGIISQFEIDRLKTGEVNEALKSLDQKVQEFLADYDQDGNQEIDTEELIAGRNRLTQDLNKEDSKLQGIINSLKALESAIIEYRKSSYYGKGENKVEIPSNPLNQPNEVENQLESVNDIITQLLVTPATDSTSQPTSFLRRRSKQHTDEIEMRIEILPK